MEADYDLIRTLLGEPDTSNYEFERKVPSEWAIKFEVGVVAGPCIGYAWKVPGYGRIMSEYVQASPRCDPRF